MPSWGAVLLQGARTEEEVAKFLASARVFALACVRDPDGGSDNLPTVIMEAMAAGLPVVSTRVAGIPEMIEDQRTGRILPEHDVPALAEALEVLLRERAMAEQWGQAGRTLVQGKFGTEITTAALKHLLAGRCAVRPPLRAVAVDPQLALRYLLRYRD